MTKTARQLEVQAKQIADLQEKARELCEVDVTSPLTPAQARKRRERLRAERLEEDKTTLIKAINFVLTGRTGAISARGLSSTPSSVGSPPRRSRACTAARDGLSSSSASTSCSRRGARSA